MPRVTKIGYLVPQFPGQTHIFFWREIKELERIGVTPVLYSTTKPPSGLISHKWSDDAAGRTTYLGKLSPIDFLAGIAMAPWRAILKEARQGRWAVLKDALISVAAAWALKRDCARQGISHVHVHSCGRAALIAAFARRMGGASYSLTLHGPLSDYGAAQKLKWRDAKFATVITQKLKADVSTVLEGSLPDRVIVRSMGVDTAHFKRETPYVAVKQGAPIKLFSCGRLNVVKGHQDLIEAVRMLRRSGLDVTLEIAGEDDAGGFGYRSELERLIEQRDVQEHVTLLGAVDAETVLAKLLGADLFVLASWHEPLGVAYMEAIACGVPTIGTKAGGVPELITVGVEGVLVPPKAPQDLAEAISRIIHNPDLAMRLSEAGRARIEREFSAHLGAETLMEEINRP